MGGGGALISIPIAVDDTVLLMFTMKDIGDWKKGSGGYTVAESTRLHDINDAIAITGLYTTQSTLKPDADDVVVKYKNSEVRLSKDNVLTVKADKVVVDHANTLELGSGATEEVVLGTTFKTLFNTHIHPTGVGPSGTPTVPMAATELSSNVTVGS